MTLPPSALVSAPVVPAIWLVILRKPVVLCRISSTLAPVERTPGPLIVLGELAVPLRFRRPPLVICKVLPALTVAPPPLSVNELIALIPLAAVVVTPVGESTLVPA